MRYAIIFLAYAVTFIYATIHLLRTGIQGLDVALFVFFLLASILALILSQGRAGWMLSALLFAFYINYYVYLFLANETLVRFGLVGVNVIAFLTSILSIPKARPAPNVNDHNIEFDEVRKAFDDVMQEAKKEKSATKSSKKKSAKSSKSKSKKKSKKGSKKSKKKKSSKKKSKSSKKSKKSKKKKS